MSGTNHNFLSIALLFCNKLNDQLKFKKLFSRLTAYCFYSSEAFNVQIACKDKSYNYHNFILAS